jgi:hypothetical protein
VYKEWEKFSRAPSFGRLLMAAPLEAGDLPKRNRQPVAICATSRHWAFRRTILLQRCRRIKRPLPLPYFTPTGL